MRFFSTKEKELINTIISIASTDSISLQVLLEKIFCSKKEGRALIIQSKEHYSVFYLKNSLFEYEKVKKEQFLAFLEVVSLLKYLSTNNYIYFSPTNHNKEESIYCIQDRFDDPRIVENSILLNKEGEYTIHPKSILNKDGNVVYKGIFIDRDTSIFLETHCQGVLFITEQFKKLVVQESKTKNNLIWKCLFIFNIITFLTLAGALFFLRHELQNQNLGTITATNVKMTSTIDLVKTKLDVLDSLLIDNNPKELSKPEPKEALFYGIDISHYNKAIVDEIKSFDSISFVICKATEGIHFRDSYFDYNWKTLKEKSIIRGAYHFYHVDSNPIHQAKHYISAVKKWEDTDITPIVDIEGQSLPSNKKSINKEKLQKNLLKFLDYVENKTKRKPMIYVSKYFADEYLLKKEFSKYPLWITDYDSEKTANLPKIWKNVGFKIWQKSNNYHFKSTRDDLDVFYGELKDIYD